MEMSKDGYATKECQRFVESDPRGITTSGVYCVVCASRDVSFIWHHTDMAYCKEHESVGRELYALQQKAAEVLLTAKRECSTRWVQEDHRPVYPRCEDV